MMSYIFCDECQNQIKVKIKTERVGKYNGEVIKFNYFQCKKCKKKYFVGIESKRVREIQREIKANTKQAREFIGLNKQDKDKFRYVNEIDELLKANNILREELNAITEQMRSEFSSWK